MPTVRIERADDPRLSAYRMIAEPELIRSQGLFIAEGRLVVERLIQSRRYALRSLLLSETACRSLESSLAALDRDTPIYVCAAEDFVNITGFNIHRGCLALAERPRSVAVGDLLGSARTLVALEAVANADNVGGVFRNALAFGVDGVLLSPTCCDPLYRKAIRTSMAATLQVPFARIEDWPDGLFGLRARGFALVALTPRDPSVPLDSFAAAGPRDRLVLVLGTEGEGLSAPVVDAADYRVRIPIRQEVDSLNLAVASGIALSRLLNPFEL
jgi:tRNA G18 (ribose-2'-O)-methylase SpoU